MYYYRCRNKKLVEWCSICNKTYEVETHGEEDYSNSLTSYRCCDKCMIDLDKEIAEEVILLNKLGYITDFSCSGHSLGEPGYISFCGLNLSQCKNIKLACKGLRYIMYESGSWSHSCAIRFYTRYDVVDYKRTSSGNIFTKRNYDVYITNLKKELQLLISKLPDISDRNNYSLCRNGYDFE